MEAKTAAHSAFQQVAFAYAILSNKKRRARYDSTGRTDEAVDLDDDDFDWKSFYKTQYAEAVTTEKLSEFSTSYKGSDEERGHVLKAYVSAKGDLNKVFEEVMLSNPLEDEPRFRAILDAAIKAGDIPALDKYTNESQKSKDKRRKKALAEAKEADEAQQELEENKKKQAAPGKSGKAKGLDDLAAMIQKRRAGQSRFLEHLEYKYAPGPSTSKRPKRSRDPSEDMPSEEAFMAARSRVDAGRAQKGRKQK